MEIGPLGHVEANLPARGQQRQATGDPIRGQACASGHAFRVDARLEGQQSGEHVRVFLDARITQGCQNRALPGKAARLGGAQPHAQTRAGHEGNPQGGDRLAARVHGRAVGLKRSDEVKKGLEHAQTLGPSDARGPRRGPGAQAQPAHSPTRPHDRASRAGPGQASNKGAGLRSIQHVERHHRGGEHLRLRESLEPAQGQRHLLLRDLLVQGGGRQSLLAHIQVQGLPGVQRRQGGTQRLINIHIGHADCAVGGVQGRGLHVKPRVHAAADAKRLEAQSLGRAGDNRVKHANTSQTSAGRDDHAGRHVEAGAGHSCNSEQTRGHHVGTLHEARKEKGMRCLPLGGRASRGRQRKAAALFQARGSRVAVCELEIHVAPSLNRGARLTQGSHIWSRPHTPPSPR